MPVRTNTFVCFLTSADVHCTLRRHTNEDKITSAPCTNRRRDKKCTCDVTTWRIRVTMQLKRDNAFCGALLRYTSLPTI